MLSFHSKFLLLLNEDERTAKCPETLFVMPDPNEQTKISTYDATMRQNHKHVLISSITKNQFTLLVTENLLKISNTVQILSFIEYL